MEPLPPVGHGSRHASIPKLVAVLSISVYAPCSQLDQGLWRYLMAGATSAWGFDVGVTSLKAIKLRRDGDQVAVEAFEVVEHEKFLSEPDIDRDAVIRATLEKFLAHHPIRRDKVFISV